MTPDANIIGIDLGNSGALALVSRDGGLLDVVDMPLLSDGPHGRPTLNAPLLAPIIAKWQARTAFIEFVGARPGDGPTGAFPFGRCRGVVEGVFAALSVPVTFITAPSWKRLIGKRPGATARKTRRAARWRSGDGRTRPRSSPASRMMAAPRPLIAVAGLLREVRR